MSNVLYDKARNTRIRHRRKDEGYYTNPSWTENNGEIEFSYTCKDVYRHVIGHLWYVKIIPQTPESKHKYRLVFWDLDNYCELSPPIYMNCVHKAKKFAMKHLLNNKSSRLEIL